jgi:formate hydrogenlyase subunit 3/multisubunit Na+/H+ antiporter MnhD subunit
MTIYLNFYLLIYLFTLIKLNYILSNHAFLINSQNSIPHLITYIFKLNKFKNVIFILFLSLAGLPPFIMFFIKFNYLINLLYKLNFFLVFIIFLIFFFNMLFYMQIFFHKNINISLVIIKLQNTRSIHWNKIFIIIWFSMFLFLSIFFFTDFFFILNLLVIGNI